MCLMAGWLLRQVMAFLYRLGIDRPIESHLGPYVATRYDFSPDRFREAFFASLSGSDSDSARQIARSRNWHHGGPTPPSLPIATGREIWLSGPIHEAVRASIALPGS
jgi:hypothetical protein